MRVAFSGGPGAGKTTVLDRFRERGYTVVTDAAREIIAERKANGLTPRPRPEEFARAILQRDIERYHSVATANSPVFFDRSILDSLCMLSELGHLSDAQQDELVRRYPFHSTVFIFPPWQEIYRMDSERDHSYEDAVLVCSSIRAWYIDSGYSLVEISAAAVDERCDFILQSLRGENNA